MVIFHSYVTLPEGSGFFSPIGGRDVSLFFCSRWLKIAQMALIAELHFRRWFHLGVFEKMLEVEPVMTHCKLFFHKRLTAKPIETHPHKWPTSGRQVRLWAERNGMGLDCWGPVLNINRDPRWGRHGEGGTEDTNGHGEKATSFFVCIPVWVTRIHVGLTFMVMKYVR